MIRQSKEHLTLEKISKRRNIYKFKDVYTSNEYYIECPTLLPDVISATNGTLDRPKPFVTLMWHIVIFAPLLFAIGHIKIESVLYALLVLSCLWLTVSLRTFIMCTCFQHSYDMTVILPDGGKYYEGIEDRRER